MYLCVCTWSYIYGHVYTYVYYTQDSFRCRIMLIGMYIHVGGFNRELQFWSKCFVRMSLIAFYRNHVSWTIEFWRHHFTIYALFVKKNPCVSCHFLVSTTWYCSTCAFCNCHHMGTYSFIVVWEALLYGLKCPGTSTEQQSQSSTAAGRESGIEEIVVWDCNDDIKVN